MSKQKHYPSFNQYPVNIKLVTEAVEKRCLSYIKNGQIGQQTSLSINDGQAKLSEREAAPYPVKIGLVTEGWL